MSNIFPGVIPKSAIVGALLQYSCSFSLPSLTDRPLSFQWIGPDGVVPYSGRISANNASSVEISGGIYVYTSMLSFSTVSSKDNNTIYQCLVGTLYTPYFTQYTPSPSNASVVVTGMSSIPCVLDAPCLVLSLSPNS